jgi:hypothetical protein
VLVLWLCWCCCAGRLGFLVDQFHKQWTFYTSPLVSGALTPPSMHLVTMLLASWVAWPASLVLGWYFGEWVMLIRSTLWWLSTVFPFYLLPLVAFLFAFPLCAGDKKNKEERKERFEDQSSLGSSLDSYMYLFSFLLYFLFGFRL